MRCAEVRQNLVAWLDGELSPEERERVDFHLAGCPHCREEGAQLESSGDLLELLESPPASLDISARVLARVLARVGEGDPWCRHIRRELVSFVDGELAEREARPIREHLLECGDCLKELRLHERVATTFPSFTAPPAAADFVDRVLVAIPRRRILRFPRFAAAVAAALLLVTVGLAALLSSPDIRTGAGEPPVEVLRNLEFLQAASMDLLEDPELLDVARDLEWLESVAEEELAFMIAKER